jgi:recombination protein RecT
MAQSQETKNQSPAKKPTELAIIKKDVVDVVGAKINQYVSEGRLHLPDHYSAENAMKSAWLILQETVDKNKQPVLKTCTRDSIANALLDMVVQGLNPAKKQGYFIAYGTQLQFQRSYFGTAAVAVRALGCLPPFAEVVYKNDEFEYEITRTGKRIKLHSQRLENVDPKNIIAAYAVIEWPVNQARAPYTEIMTIDQIKQSWKMSKMNPDAADSTHSKYPDQMAKRTVINRACKLLINATKDNDLLIEHFNRSEQVEAEQELNAEAELLANDEIIDIQATEPEPEPELNKAAPENGEQATLGDIKEKQTKGPGF